LGGFFSTGVYGFLPWSWLYLKFSFPSFYRLAVGLYFFENRTIGLSPFSRPWFALRDYAFPRLVFFRPSKWKFKSFFFFCSPLLPFLRFVFECKALWPTPKSCNPRCSWPPDSRPGSASSHFSLVVPKLSYPPPPKLRRKKNYQSHDSNPRKAVPPAGNFLSNVSLNKPNITGIGLLR